jgi:segregation and condensation protein A
MPDAPYRIRLPAFEGPLDLLLQLIEREKLDISSVSLAQVADQFLSYVHSLTEVEAEMLADFLTVAVRLVWIKSRLLLPQAASQADEEEEDPGEALARQLREYKRFKEAAAALRAIEDRGLHTYLREAGPPELELKLVPGSGALDDLLRAARSALVAAPETAAPLPGGLVVPFTMTIQDQIGLIRSRTTGGARVRFHDLLTSHPVRTEIIVTLLAVLELIKRRLVEVVQEAPFADIYIVGSAGVDLSEAGADDSSEE